MGNNNGACFLRLRGSLPFPSHLQLGTAAIINMKTSTSDFFYDIAYAENAEVLYTVEGSECKLTLQRQVCYDYVRMVSFVLNDSIICSDNKNLCLSMVKAETGMSNAFMSPIAWTKTRKKVDAWGGVTDTKVYLYGTANRCGLLVLECKKNDYHDERTAKAVTLAHYFVRSNSSVAISRSSETTQIGFSVVAKVGLCDGKFDITVEGPEPHPVSALLYMFDEVNRSGIWKPSMCPHCRNIRREHNRMFLQSDSEDSDGRRQHPVTIDNGGRFRGHGCGARVRGDFIVNN
ncbi:hypothetical protein LR48_Vigan10g014600 [Vigna angularis]|uniref:Uncharacterized protein n=2 Tax=Phaseolus angularis TaxID=3914 RepID=A0A0L9VHS0_PHAAN|nr:uncharacterized protein HKW66_Vig0123620 [Vigna angularis]KOM54254.1 hypothetical protein LR48_Vigan10g014600 [Vigna angularis]BAU02866.1 hypothetical protein VIGAN_11246100 [Vigna angularis var. angularis]